MDATNSFTKYLTYTSFQELPERMARKCPQTPVHSSLVPCVLPSTVAAQLLAANVSEPSALWAPSQQHGRDPVPPCATSGPIPGSQWGTAASGQSPDTCAPRLAEGEGEELTPLEQLPEAPGRSPALALPRSQCSHVNLEYISGCQHRCETHLARCSLCSEPYQRELAGAPAAVR